jgi:hypothetical protein
MYPSDELVSVAAKKGPLFPGYFTFFGRKKEAAQDAT